MFTFNTFIIEWIPKLQNKIDASFSGGLSPKMVSKSSNTDFKNKNTTKLRTVMRFAKT